MLEASDGVHTPAFSYCTVTVVAAVRAVAGDVLVFAHAHILRVVAARWLELPAGDGSRWVLSPASVSVLGWEREIPVIERWNDTGGAPLA